MRQSLCKLDRAVLPGKVGVLTWWARVIHKPRPGPSVAVTVTEAAARAGNFRGYRKSHFTEWGFGIRGSLLLLS